jgi:hypothetical protein
MAKRQLWLTFEERRLLRRVLAFVHDEVVRNKPIYDVHKFCCRVTQTDIDEMLQRVRQLDAERTDAQGSQPEGGEAAAPGAVGGA